MLVDEVEPAYDGCNLVEERERRTGEYLKYLHSRWWKDIMIARHWDITLEAVSKARPDMVTREQMAEFELQIKNNIQQNQNINHV